MRKFRKDKLLATLSELDEKTAPKFVPVLDEFDKFVKAATKAIAAAEKAKGNLSAQILTTVRVAPSASMLLTGLDALRSVYKSDSGEYNQYNVALTHVRNAFRRVTGEDDVEVWDKDWKDVQKAAKDAPNFSQFVSPPKPDASDEDDETDEDEADEPTPQTAAPEPSTNGEVPEVDPEEWSDIQRARYAHLKELMELSVKEEVITARYAEALVSLMREAINSKVTQPAAPAAPWKTGTPKRRRRRETDRLFAVS